MNSTHNIHEIDGFSIGTVSGEHTLDYDRDIPQGDPRLSNPFEDFEAVYPMAPCRRIEITPEMVAKDAAERAEREAQHRAAITWTPPTSASRPEPKAPLVLSPIEPRHRESANAGRNRSSKLPFCIAGCGNRVSYKSKQGRSRECSNARRHDEALAARSQQPAALAARSQQPAASSQQPAASSQQPAAKRSSSRTPVSSPKSFDSGGCEGNPNERTWFEEQELDELWASLSVSDKWSLLEEVIG